MGSSRIGILGGTFDPIHLGHLILASDAATAMELDEVVFVPSSQSPLKGYGPVAPERERIDLIRTAIKDDARFSVDTLEIERGGASYSIDTARALKGERPHDSLFWLIGTDQAKQLNDWRAIDELRAIVQFVSMDRRQETTTSRPSTSEDGVIRLGARRIDISSTEIRNSFQEGRCAKYFLPEAVHELIKARGLYTARKIKCRD